MRSVAALGFIFFLVAGPTKAASEVPPRFKGLIETAFNVSMVSDHCPDYEYDAQALNIFRRDVGAPMDYMEPDGPFGEFIRAKRGEWSKVFERSSKGVCDAFWRIFNSQTADVPPLLKRRDARRVQTTTPVEPFLSDLLKPWLYQSQWRSLLGPEMWLPQWVHDFEFRNDNPSNPSIAVTVEGQVFRLADGCDKQNCADNNMHVLFGPGGQRVWALIRETGKSPRWVGQPDEKARAILTSARFVQP